MAEPRELAGGLTADPTASAPRVEPRAPVGTAGPGGFTPSVDDAELTPTERRLLADLFAIVEEHAEETAMPVDRDRVVEAFLFACRHHADQRRKSGEEFIIHPVGVAKICAGLRPRHRDAVRGAAARHGRGHDRRARARSASSSATRSPRSSTASRSSTGITFTSRDEAQAENYRKMMVAMATRHPGHPHQARRPPAQHAHDRRAAEAEADRQGHARPWRSTRRSRTASASTRSSGSWRTSRSPPCTRASTRRSRAWSTSSATSASTTSRAAGADAARRSSTRSGIERRDLRAGQALLLDLLEDDPQGPRVQRDLRPHGDARDRRLGQGLLRRGRRDPLALEAAARPLQGLRSRCRSSTCTSRCTRR